MKKKIKLDDVDVVFKSTSLTEKERKQISDIIAHYKATGEKMLLQKKNKKK